MGLLMCSLTAGQPGLALGTAFMAIDDTGQGMIPLRKTGEFQREWSKFRSRPGSSSRRREMMSPLLIRLSASSALRDTRIPTPGMWGTLLPQSRHHLMSKTIQIADGLLG